MGTKNWIKWKTSFSINPKTKLRVLKAHKNAYDRKRPLILHHNWIFPWNHHQWSHSHSIFIATFTKSSKLVFNKKKSSTKVLSKKIHFWECGTTKTDTDWIHFKLTIFAYPKAPEGLALISTRMHYSLYICNNCKTNKLNKQWVAWKKSVKDSQDIMWKKSLETKMLSPLIITARNRCMSACRFFCDSFSIMEFLPEMINVWWLINVQMNF